MMKKRKKNTIVLILVVVLLAIITLIIQKNNISGDDRINSFAVLDTASITKIFLADKNGNTVLLDRLSPREWQLNESFVAGKSMIESILSTIINIEVKGIVPEAAHNTAVKNLAAKHTKIEIYQIAPKFKIFGIDFFTKERLTKVYYVGGATQDNLGTYMRIEGDDVVNITFVPGQNAFLSLRYSPKEKDWRDHGVISESINNIEFVEVSVTGKPEESYKIFRTGEKSFSINLKNGQPVPVPFDSARMLDFLASFRNINYEGLLNDLDPTKRDSIINTSPMYTVNVMTRDDQSYQLKSFRRRSKYQSQDEVTGQEIIWDRDRLYILFNNGKDFALCQYFTFDKILRPLSYFTHSMEEEINKTY